MADSFEPSLGCLTGPVLAGLAAQLRSVPGLDSREAQAVTDATAAVLTEAALRRVSRVLLLELNAARITGQLRAPDQASRWQEWLSATTSLSFWDSLGGHYPTLLPRLRRMLANRSAAALTLASRFAADRPAFAPGPLTSVRFGAGDSHHGGQTVAVITTVSGRVAYKPRPVEVDERLASLLDVALPADPARIAVPAVIVRPGYGWSEYVEHRYCEGERELSAFYRNIGHWLAVMRLLGGSDLHAENIIAAGPVPFVVDCEALFTPHDPYPPTGYGAAHDEAVQLLADSALRTGLLPGRGQALGWRGVDSSAVGALPGQQPRAIVPVIVGAGTDEARLGYESLPIPPGGNHPSPAPVLARYWDKVVSGFDELTARLHRLDRAGRLDEPLAAFAGCRVRVVARPTETYMELGRMLWHPAALHDEATAVKQAAELLAAHAGNASTAPAEPGVILAEIAELLDGDVPVFETTAGTGRLSAPRGTAFGRPRDLIAEARARWRAVDHDLDLRVVSDTLVSAYLNEGWQPSGPPMRVSRVSSAGQDKRRRATAASIMRTVTEAAIRGTDGSATWIAPIISPTGWAVQPLSNDLYNGLSGIAVAAAGYQREVKRDRADPVPGLGELLEDLLRTMRMIEVADAKLLAGETEMRPDAPGGYVGLGSLVWAWLLLGRLGAPGVDEAEAIARARAAAALLPGAIAQDEELDLFRGMAGAVVPLLRLAERTGEQSWLDLADQIGDRLADRARVEGGTARWPNTQYPDGIGGAAHGATGIGWALARLCAVQAGNSRHAQLAEAAFAFEESLYDAARNGWDDRRDPGHIAGAWCHGGGGIAIVAADLIPEDPARWRDVLRRGAASAWQHGLGWNHTLCHGDLGLWEVMMTAFGAGACPPGQPGLTSDDVAARVLGGLGEHGPVSGLARDALTPGLLPGLGGMAYQLLRMHPGCDLPSVLLPDPGPPGPL